MKQNNYSFKDTLIIGLMMFALFLGAGNLIFPPALGQEAGTSVWPAITGFLITGVGLPVLAIIAVAKSGGDLQQISKRVGSVFGLLFPLAVYLAIGPLFGIPRTGSVGYEIGVLPYLAEGGVLSLFLFTLVFFSLSYWLSLNPSKLVSRIGKILTPILVVVLSVLTFSGVFSPPGEALSPTGTYESFPFFTGFQEGYFTMDAIAALVFGIIVITRMKERGLTDRKALTQKAFQVGLIAGTGLIFVYLSLAYLGSTSVSLLGYQENGGVILTGLSQFLLGGTGLILLSTVITIACLTTSVGLISAFGEYVQKTFKAVPYWAATAAVTVFSFVMANMGLTQLIQFSLPMLVMIYPVAIVLIILTLFDELFKGRKEIYVGSVAGAALVSIADGLATAGIFPQISTAIIYMFPLAEIGIAWLIPSIIGGVAGYVFQTVFHTSTSRA
ncbi:branched-chain amino acid transport system II carrier protein [Salipaludibacillus sp. CUR1]|uniref:branched-chain amino acid transport system II carrier protein n=1 Tax=Salipaludibacillus sp. CUR1 TaxID=2820003 RepID=UPI001E6249EC|nr:branched-chain amino acid transport system II carrier protein [Salipaludibacillus sp. CUR1]MCE7793333.1 branched-chain amino acid transport system II carrier protein [Salipaludibacillus sp. CUR1]